MIKLEIKKQDNYSPWIIKLIKTHRLTLKILNNKHEKEFKMITQDFRAKLSWSYIQHKRPSGGDLFWLYHRL